MRNLVVGFAAGAAFVYYLPQLKKAVQGVQSDGVDRQREAVVTAINLAAEKATEKISPETDTPPA